ncbi:hypothetical protein [Streptomyces sp. NPDC101150]|uniref:hypothetical protein n=1 Tax=Streptomyces sp. NPDC101150 TaxID=3366114 RepID=UPI003803955E
MTSLFERLDEEEAIVRGELSALRDRVAQAEERLARLAITRETAVSLLGHEAGPGSRGTDSTQPPGPADSAADAGTPSADGPKGASEHDEGEPELEELPLAVAQERILALLGQVGRPMKLQDIVPAIGEKRTETTRSRIKAMARRGLVVEGPIAWFRIAPTDVPTEEAAAAS